MSQKGNKFSFGMSKEPTSSSKQIHAKLNSLSLAKQNIFKKQKAEKDAKKKSDELAAAREFENFKALFEDADKTSQKFVVGQVINPDDPDAQQSSSKVGELYNPAAKAAQLPSKSKLAAPKPTTIEKLAKKKEKGKKSSILELFRDELKRTQEDRHDRQRLRREGKLASAAAAAASAATTPKILSDIPSTMIELEDDFQVSEFDELYQGSHDTGDPLTTNLYVGNISPKMNEEMLCQTFARFGPLASVKVMWPRTEEERSRNKNCGFVAYMKREDGARCLDEMRDAEIMGFKIQIGWGKSVALPPHPIYVATNQKEEEEAKLPDPPSGLPFNAQKSTKQPASMNKVPPPNEAVETSYRDEKFGETLFNSMVRVVIPTDKAILCLIHRMIEFVIREGPIFEAMIMNRELSNPSFQFLFDNQSPAHIYYRWKLFSILQGDSPETWRTDEFRMFRGGSIWKPPPLKKMQRPLPSELQEIVKKGQLSSKLRDKLEELLRNITMEKKMVIEAMIWCVEHAEGSEEIIDCITESLTIAETPLTTKVARLYLITDILHNCAAKVSNVSSYRRGFESKMTPVFEHFHTIHMSIPSKMKAEQFRKRVMSVLRALQALSIYHWDFMTKLINTFVGHTYEEMEKKKAFDIIVGLMTKKAAAASAKPTAPVTANIDGIPIDENQPIDFSRMGPLADIDGVPLEDMQNIDGQPLEDDIDGEPLDTANDGGDHTAMVVKTVSSKWEHTNADQESGSEDSLFSKPSKLAKDLSQKGNDELQRKKLREIEVQVMKLQDALESSGSYTRAEVMERVVKFRDKLKQEALTGNLMEGEPGEAGSNKKLSDSPSPSRLVQYDLDESPKSDQRDRSDEKKIAHSPPSDKSDHHHEEQAVKKKSATPPSSRKHKLKSKDASSKRRRSRSRSVSPVKKKRRSYSRSPRRSRRSRSRSPRHKKSRSPSRRKNRSVDRSPHSRRSRSRSPKKSRKRSRSPKDKHKRSSKH